MTQHNSVMGLPIMIIFLISRIHLCSVILKCHS